MLRSLIETGRAGTWAERWKFFTLTIACPKGRPPASLRNLAISLLRLDGHANIAAANRHRSRDPGARSRYFNPRECDFAVSLRSP